MPTRHQETPTSTKLEEELAAAIRDFPQLFQGVSAVKAASALVKAFGSQSLLITEGRIHLVQEADHRGDNGAGSVEWAVYTNPEDNE